MSEAHHLEEGALDEEELVRRYGRLISSLCWRLTRDEERAREAAQEVWVELLRSLPGFRGESSLSTWIYRLTWRTVKRHTEGERRFTVRFLREHFSGPDIEAPELPQPDHELWVRKMCDRCLAGTLQCLEPEARLAYVLREVAECSYDEVAEVLESTPAAVRQEVSRARRKLNRFLRGQCALYNPQGACRCRMRRHVDRVDLPGEYARLRRSARQVRLYHEAEQILPDKNYWLDLLAPTGVGH